MEKSRFHPLEFVSFVEFQYTLLYIFSSQYIHIHTENIFYHTLCAAADPTPSERHKTRLSRERES